ncbi:tetratricopeptide repeat protein [Sporocytophaga myxococcoides]|uniref:tetratricopeptide repeat protein n=1 Tax=Sporocytophaga myxococcoides TaxID=153721 RepID=UPI000407B5EC|nr:tetratricopeptide repeat protein [Sporocytophaga myxococcoides]
MKKTLSILFTLFSVTVFAQTAEEYLQSGLEKHNKEDYSGAIKDYTLAIKADKKSKTAYFNRGACELALKNLEAAMEDFNNAIEIDPNYPDPHYGRATVFATLERYKEALAPLDKAIELDPKFPNALNFRGQLRAQTGNKKGACEDFIKADKQGDLKAGIYLDKYCNTTPRPKESFILNWPEDEHWVTGNSQEDDQVKITELIHANESMDKWTEMGYMSSIKSARVLSVEKAMSIFYDQAKTEAPKAKLTLIEQSDSTAQYPWIIFTIEAPEFINDHNPESQLWYVVLGNQSLYANFIAVKEASFPKDKRQKWINFFKTGKVVSKP